MMQQALALETLAGGEVDDELAWAIQSLSDATSREGPRYEPRVVRILVQLIAARAYGRALLELAHLLGVAERAGGRHGAAGFFWSVERARASSFREAILVGLDDVIDSGMQVEMNEEGVRIDHPDGVFVVNFGRMALLAALFEFLVVTVGYDAVSAAAKVMTRGLASARAAGSCANDLSRLLYDYLRGRLPNAHHHRQHRRLVEHMTDARGAAFQVGDIDDAAVLSFWERVIAQHAAEPAEVKSIRAIVASFIQFRRAYKAVIDRRALAEARGIGTDHAAGEVDPEDLEATLDALEDQPDRVAELLSVPLNAIKFLNKRECERLELIGRHGEHARALALSVLRAGIFGDMQGRLTEAKRRRRTVSEIEAVIAEGPAETHDDRLDMLRKLAGHLWNCRLSALHVLARHQSMDALGLLVDLFPDLDLAVPFNQRPSEDGGGEVIPIQARGLLRDLATGEGAVAEQAAIAARGFRQVSRQGFSDERADDPEHAQLFAGATSALAAVQRDLDAYLKAVTGDLASDDRRALVRQDQALFRNAFRILYGSST